MDRIEKLKDFLEKNPGDAFVRHALALEYVKLGEDMTARGLFETILNDQPDYIGSYYHLGKLLERQGDPELARSWLERGIAKAKAANDRHALNELQGALDELE